MSADSSVRKVFDVWTDVAEYCKSAGRNVFAAHCADDGLIEVFGFTGNSDDAGLHAFADSTEANDFVARIKGRGFIKFNGCDNLGDDWALIDCVSLRDFVSPGAVIPK